MPDILKLICTYCGFVVEVRLSEWGVRQAERDPIWHPLCDPCPNCGGDDLVVADQALVGSPDIRVWRRGFVHNPAVE